MSDGSIVDAEIESISMTLAEIAESLRKLLAQQRYQYLHRPEDNAMLRIDRNDGRVWVLREYPRMRPRTSDSDGGLERYQKWSLWEIEG